MNINSKNTKIVFASMAIAIIFVAVWGRGVIGQDDNPLESVEGKTTPSELVSTKDAVQIKEVNSLISLSSEKRKMFSPLEPIEVQLVMTNNSKQKVSFIENSASEDFDIMVKDSYGSIMPRTRFGEKPIVPTASATAITILEPGQSEQFSMSINRIVDMTVDGKYFITLRRSIAVGKRAGYSESNVLGVEVAAKDSDEGAKTLPGGEAIEGP